MLQNIYKPTNLGCTDISLLAYLKKYFIHHHGLEKQILR